MAHLDIDKVLILVLEMQPPIVASSVTCPPGDLKKAIRTLLRTASTLGVQVLVSAVPLGPDEPELIEELGDRVPMVRTTVSAFEDEIIRNAVMESGCLTIAIAGVSTEIAVTHAALDARMQGYDVLVLTDCCGGLGERSEAASFRQMTAAGVVLSGVATFLTSLAGDLTASSGQTVMTAIGEMSGWDHRAATSGGIAK